MIVDFEELLKQFDVPPLNSLDQKDVALLTDFLKTQDLLYLSAVILRLLGGSAYFHNSMVSMIAVNDNLIESSKASLARQNILEERVEKLEDSLRNMSYMKTPNSTH